MRQILWTLKILFGWDFSLAHYVNDATGGHSERGCPCCRGLVFMSSRKPLPSSTAPQVLTASSPAQQAENEAKASSSVLINESEPTTNIQIRLADGGRLVQKFNHSHRYLCGQVWPILSMGEVGRVPSSRPAGPSCGPGRGCGDRVRVDCRPALQVLPVLTALHSSPVKSAFRSWVFKPINTLFKGNLNAKTQV